MEPWEYMGGMGGFNFSPQKDPNQFNPDQYALLERQLGGMDNLQSATINARNGQQTELSGMSPEQLSQLDRYTNLNSYAQNSPFGNSLPGRALTGGTGMGFILGSEALKMLPESFGEGAASLYEKLSGKSLASPGQAGPFTRSANSSAPSWANVNAGFEGLLRGMGGLFNR